MQRVVLFEARWPHSHGRTGPGSCLRDREGTCLSGSQRGMASLSAISVATLFNGLQAR